MKSEIIALLAGGALVAVGGAALAHHSFAMFDSEHPMEIAGTVREFRFVSPHTILIVTVKGQDGASKDWILEGGAPGMLVRDGMERDESVRLLRVSRLTGAPTLDTQGAVDVETDGESAGVLPATFEIYPVAINLRI